METQRRRARELGIAPGRLRPGPHNAITDVAGVRVGHTTVRAGRQVHTGVTAIVPDAVDVAGGELAAGLFVGNGYGKMTGTTQVVELGRIETPIVLTGTLSAFRVADALVSCLLAMPGNRDLTSVNAVVGETNDGFLSDIRARPVTEAHVLAALSGARGGAVGEGAVGAGTGTGALGFKAGIGTASRIVPLADRTPSVVGVLLQANFSGTLSVLGVPIGREAALAGKQAADTGAGRPVPDSALGPVFSAVQEAVEEAVLNSIFMAETTEGHRGRVLHACPHDFVIGACQGAGVLGRPQ